MKTALLFLALLGATSFAGAQPSQRPIFFPPTDTLDQSETTATGRREVVLRRTIILLGFLPRTSKGERHAFTGPLTSEPREVRLEATSKSRNFEGVFSSLKAELLKIDAHNPTLRRWKFESPPLTSGWSGFGYGPLNATPTMGTISYLVSTQRFEIEGSSDAKNIRVNPSGKGHALHFKGSIDTQVDGPFVRAFNKGLPFDFQTLPTQEQMEALRKHDSGE